MELIGRLTADAKVNTLKDDRKVVNFSVAINDRYKTKEGELKEVATFVNCAYWISPGIASYLTKGTLVELYGRIGVNAWNNMDGEARATLTLHVSNIKLHGGKNLVAEPAGQPITQQPGAAAADDLPF